MHRVTAACEVPRLRLFVLGGFHVERDGDALANSMWSRRSARTLVEVLAAEPGHRLHREQLEDILWPNVVPERAYINFRQALRAARLTLEPDVPHRAASRYLHFGNDVVTLLADAVWIYADDFEQLGNRALADGDRAALEAALAIYAGELLPDARYADWPAIRRQQLDANTYAEAIHGHAPGIGVGVVGDSDSNYGVWGQSGAGDGVHGASGKNGVHGVSSSATDSGVWGENTGTGFGAAGSSATIGVLGAAGGAAAPPSGTIAGVCGVAVNNDGVYGAANGNGVHGRSTGGTSSGVWGENTSYGDGVAGSSGSGDGVRGASGSGIGGHFSGPTAPLLLDPISGPGTGGTGHPTSGAHQRGEFVVDMAGTVFVCTLSGDYSTSSPPSWQQLLFASAVAIALKAGWNLVSGPYPTSGLSTDTIVSQVTQAGGDVKAIAIYQNGAYKLYVPGSSAPFSVPPQSGMFILSSKSCTWTPH